MLMANDKQQQQNAHSKAAKTTFFMKLFATLHTEYWGLSDTLPGPEMRLHPIVSLDT
jgi:hypothetical protein